MPPVLKCPHCSGVVSPEAKVCPGCGATKKMAGGSGSKAVRNVVMFVGAALGGAAGFAVKWYFYPNGAGVGSYIDAIALGIVAGGVIARFMTGWDEEETKALPVWEKPKG